MFAYHLDSFLYVVLVGIPFPHNTLNQCCTHEKVYKPRCGVTCNLDLQGFYAALKLNIILKKELLFWSIMLQVSDDKTDLPTIPDSPELLRKIASNYGITASGKIITDILDFGNLVTSGNNR